MIEVILPAPLRRLARIEGRILLDAPRPSTQRALLDAVEGQYPALQGTIRDRETGQRRAYVRFFACNMDLSDVSPDTELPDAVTAGREPFLVVGALAGG